MSTSQSNEHPLLARAREMLPEAIELRRQIHRHPELGNETPRTRAAVLAALEGLDLDIKYSERTSGLIAVLKGSKPGPSILVRGDMDGLPMPEETGLAFASEIPGRMHACGHDAHTAMLAGAVHLLNEQRAALAGEVHFMFQPGEEGPGGAEPMIEEGLVNADAGFALHINPNHPTGLIATRPGSIMAGVDEVRIVVQGTGGHGGMPHLANDPMPVACEIVLALQTYCARRVGPFEGVVMSVGTLHGGTVSNVIPDEVEMNVSFRYLADVSRENGHRAMTRIAEQIAAAHEMSASVEIERGYPPTVNDAAFTQIVSSAVSELLGDSALVEMPEPVLGAEDFAFVLREIPGTFAFLGVAPEGIDAERAPGCHSTRMTIDESAMALGIATHAKVVMDYLGADESLSDTG